MYFWESSIAYKKENIFYQTVAMFCIFSLAHFSFLAVEQQLSNLPATWMRAENLWQQKLNSVSCPVWATPPECRVI